MTEPTVRAGGYTRVSTEEQAERGRSMGEQEHLIRERVAEKGWELIDMFSDPGYSGAREDRPGLQEMLARLDELDVIVVYAMDRLTRDVELFAKLVKRLTAASVRVESLTAHVDLSTPEGEAMAGVSAVFGQFERARTKERVRDILAGRAREGLNLGGPPPDGWMDVPTGERGKRGQPIHDRVHDPERAPVIVLLFKLAAEGMSDTAIARRLNEDDHRTRSGRSWTRRAVQNNVTNAWHAGRVMLHRGKPRQKVFEGQHEHLVDPAVFDRIQEQRTVRDLAEPSQKRTGRPNTNHALARLAVCGRCGGRMGAFTSSYRRKRDGGRKRFYRCIQAYEAPGMCDATSPFDAEAVDADVIAGLDTLLVDFGAWRQRIEDSHGAERDRLSGEVERAQSDYDAQDNKAAKVEAKWSEYLAAGDDAKADLVLPIVERERQAATAAGRRLKAAEDAFASVPTEAPTDAMLDFANGLQEAIKGRVDPADSMAQVNEALREVFARFVVREEPAIGWDSANPFKPHPERKQIVIQPWLKPGVIAPPSDPELGWAWPRAVSDDPPPLRWLESAGDPEGNVQNPHA